METEKGTKEALEHNVKALAQCKKTQDPIVSDKKIKKTGSQGRSYLRRGRLKFAKS